IQNVSGLINPFYAVSSAFKIDAVRPTTPTINVPTGWTNIVSVEIMPGVDEDSGVKETNYRIGKEGVWGEWTELGEDRNIIIEEEGEITVVGVTMDHAGNLSDFSSEVVKIDRTAPELLVYMT